MAHDTKKDVLEDISWDQVRYSMVWEDHLLLQKALEINSDDRVLSIISAGDNALALLLQEPRQVVAIDINPCQSALLNLKLAGIKSLDYQEFTCLMGVNQGADRLYYYEKIRQDLPPGAIDYWDRHQQDISHGLLLCGKLERYFIDFQKQHLAKIHPPEVVEQLFTRPTLLEQEAFFKEKFATKTFQEKFKWYFGREMMAKTGRDPAQFKYVKLDEVGDYFFSRFRYACTKLPLNTNFYLQFFLTSRFFNLEQGPLYLQKANFYKLKQLLPRIAVVTGQVESVLREEAPGTFSKANFSDIFEYMTQEAADLLLAEMADRFQGQGRIAYWSLLVPRGRSESLAQQLRSLDQIARQLWTEDRSWFYQSYHVYEVV